MVQRVCIDVRDPAHLARARAWIARQERPLPQRADAALIATELGSNQLCHAGGGQLLLSAWDQGLEVVALDWGDGVTDWATAVRDGYSTRAGPGGIGLGAVWRLAQAVDVWSAPGQGSVVRAQVGPAPPAATLSVPGHGRTRCADGVLVERLRDRLRIAVVDVAGQGPRHTDFAEQAIGVCRQRRRVSPQTLVLDLHERARAGGIRGSAVVADLTDSGQVIAAGCGEPRLCVDGDPIPLPHGQLGIAVDASPLTRPWNDWAWLTTDGIDAAVPSDGSPGLRAARAVWASSRRDDRSVVVVQRAV